MRITGGKLKGLTIDNEFSSFVRPTTDMVREAIMNSLFHSNKIEGSEVLEVFSGSGIVALELISRGAKFVTSIEKDKKNVAHLKRMQKKLSIDNWNIVSSDYLKFCKMHLDKEYHLIFADPPYDAAFVQNLPSELLPLLAPGGLLLIEHRKNTQFNVMIDVQKNYGLSSISYFKSNRINYFL